MPDFFYRFRGGGVDKHCSIPSFRHSGRSDKNQCRERGGGGH